jgi:hypothetical protein
LAIKSRPTACRAVRAADVSDADFALLDAVVVPDEAGSFDIQLD